MTIKTTVISSLEKVFADEELKARPISSASAFNNEVFSFQVAFKSEGPLMKNVTAHIQSELESFIQIRTVGIVPSEFPIYHDHDDHILRNQAGLFPDPLYPMDSEGLTVFPNQWRAIWVSVHLEEDVVPGSYLIPIQFKDTEGNLLGEESFHLVVLPASLPKQTLIHTQWFHTDSIMEQYGVEAFSEDYWYWVEKYIKTAVNHGINMLLTPLFTPPLDTEIGKERPTVQLVDVKKVKGEYSFQFDKLSRWVEIGLRNGLGYFEFSHLFTQWGAHHAPKIIAEVDGEEKKVFGWETQADSEEYVTFLSRFLPELKSFIYDHNLEEKVYFHVSDEPMLEHMDSYRHARDIMQKHLDEFPIMDALSDYAFYENGLVKRPIPSTDHIDPFIDNHVPDLWTYYCCAQYKDVANRFFAFPSARNRIIGLQLYKYNIKGFLQWGYNFWFSQLSRKSIDPFKNTDAGYGFPSGDAFIVYPGKKGPIESIRMEVFYDALQDMRALQLLESLIGKEAVIDLLEQGIDTPITFKKYPR
ncbi:DUF4091 domain-containing protein, partial [Alkalibacterium iburiense]